VLAHTCSLSMLIDALPGVVACGFIGSCNPTDPRLLNFTRLVIKIAEHTWGEDVKRYLHDHVNWPNSQFHAELNAQPPHHNYVTIMDSWLEQRRWGLDIPLQA